MLASCPASMLNQNRADSGIPNRFRPKSSRSKPQRFAHRLFHLVLVKILHQPQHLDELAPPHGPHPGFHEPPQPMNTVRKPPIIQGRRLIERLGLLFQQGQIM
jgi:hypothetical protein